MQGDVATVTTGVTQPVLIGTDVTNGSDCVRATRSSDPAD